MFHMLPTPACSEFFFAVLASTIHRSDVWSPVHSSVVRLGSAVAVALVIAWSSILAIDKLIVARVLQLMSQS